MCKTTSALGMTRVLRVALSSMATNLEAFARTYSYVCLYYWVRNIWKDTNQQALPSQKIEVHR